MPSGSADAQLCTLPPGLEQVGDAVNSQKLKMKTVRESCRELNQVGYRPFLVDY